MYILQHWSGFTSVSLRENVARSFAGKGCVLFVVRTALARDASPYSGAFAYFLAHALSHS